MRRNSRYDAALNRVLIGSAPKLGSAGSTLYEAEEKQRNIWFRWRAHSSTAVMVRARRPKEATVAECTSKPLDLGGDITNAEVRFIDGEPSGVYYMHPCVDGKVRAGYVPIARVPAPPHNEWKLEQLEPLTISPSLLCTACKHHGFIRDGKWVRA